MTDEEIRETAKEVLANKTRSHVRAAAELAQWVLARLEEEDKALATVLNAVGAPT